MKCCMCDNHGQMDMMFVMMPRYDHDGWREEFCFSCAEKKFRDMAKLFKRKKIEDRHFTQQPVWLEKLMDTTIAGDCK